MIRNEKGFTLVELLVTLALTGVVMIAVYKTFTWQQKVHAVQESVAMMQQDCRVGMEVMLRDLRMAGYSPAKAGVASIKAATATSIQFTKDLSGNGICETTVDTNGNGVIEQCEDITYSLSGAGLNWSLVRNDTVNTAALVSNVDALDFVYLKADGTDITALVIADPASNIPNIRSIQVTVVVRSDMPDKDFRSTATYRNQQGTPLVLKTAADNRYRHRVLTATVRCRNLGTN